MINDFWYKNCYASVLGDSIVSVKVLLENVLATVVGKQFLLFYH